MVLARIDQEVIVLVGITASATVALTWIVMGILGSVLKSKHREETRREIAAYVAEGSISPQDGAALLSAEPDEIRKRVADGLAWGTLSAKGAERLLNATANGPQKARAS